MTEPDATAERREIATALVHALERRHEVLDAVVASDDYDAAIESLAELLDTSAEAAEAVLRLSFDRLTKVSRQRIAAELANLDGEVPNYTRPGQAAWVPPVDVAAVRPRAGSRHLRRPHRGHALVR